MANITYRVNSDPAIPGTSIVKGAPLTNVEVDANFRAIDIEVDQLNSSTVRLTGDQTIAGVKTFSSPIAGSITGNAGTVTNGVYTTGDQTIGGIKTFTGMIRLSGDPAAVGTAGTTGILEIGDNSGNTPATMSFHKQGYAINMGLDTDNVFRLGGWSQGLNVHRWTSDTSGNFTALGNITAGGSINAASYNGGQLAGMRNKIINGKMEIAQRGTSFGAIASGAYSLDRWVWAQSGTGVVTISQQADAPSSNEFQNSIRAAVTTADTSIDASDAYLLLQRIEGFNVRDLIGRTFTVSFWVRSSKTGVHCCYFTNSGIDRSYVVEYTVNVANTWEYKTVTVSGGLITAGTWNWTNGMGLEAVWTLAAGSTRRTTANSWQTGFFAATNNQVNCLDTVGNIFAITGVQLEPGSVNTPFEHRSIGAELALCQRYYEKSFGLFAAPANGPDALAFTDVQNSFLCGAVYEANELGNVGSPVVFKVLKRATPTMTAFGNNTGGWAYKPSGGSIIFGAVTWRRNNEKEALASINVSTTTTGYLGGHWTASAEL